jgi:hypothetical protein
MEKSRTMLHRAIQASLVGCAFAVAGCGGGGDTPGAAGTGGTAGTGGAATCSPAATITAAPDNNYKFHSELTIDVTKVKPSAEIHFDWSGVTTDLLGHPVNLADIGMVEIGLWQLTLEQFQKKLNDDSLNQQDLAIIATIIPSSPAQTTGSIYDLTEMGEPITKANIDGYLDINAYPPANHLYTAMVANGTVLGQGTRMIQGFQLDASSMNTDVKVVNTSTSLTMSADMHSLATPNVPVANPAVTVDWTDMDTSVNPANTTAAGLPFDPTQITELRVGAYSMSLSDMEKQSNFLNLDMLATTLYRAEVTAGTKIELSRAKDPMGNAFPGFDSTHTWIVALNCGECANPAPWYMTVVKPCAQ